MSNCQPRITPVCDKEIVSATETTGCDTFSICLPFGGMLTSNGGCISHTPGTPPPDGIYDKVVIMNGCLYGVEAGDIPIYTTAPCAPIPSPCDCDGEGSLPQPSTTTGNLFQYDAAGRPLVLLTIQAGDGIAISGLGTTADPLVISSTIEPGTSISIQSGSDAITVTGNGFPYRIGHTSYYTGTILGMTITGGHVVDYTEPTEAGVINGIISGEGIEVTVNTANGIATISLADPTTIYTGVYRWGAYDVELYKNRIVRMARVIDFPAGTYRIGNYDITFNEDGAATDIAYIAPDPDDPTVVSVGASKRFATNGENDRSFSIQTSEEGGFRITYSAASIPSDIQLFVDNVNISGDIINGRFEAITPALYAIGSHTILVQTALETGFAGIGYLDMTIVTVV